MRELDISSTAKLLITFIQATVTNAGFSRVVIAASGGVDSSTAAALAVEALGSQNVYALLLPFRDWHAEAGRLARLLLHQFHIPTSNVCELNIAPMVEAFIQSLTLNSQMLDNHNASADLDKLRMGNIMARVRMVALFDHARKLDALVLGTENKSEHYLGYFTRFGDEASDVEPLRSLYKTEVYQLAEHLQVPEEIRDADPTAGLWAGQTDEGQFGFTYKDADEILQGLFEAGLSSQELVALDLDWKTIQSVQAWVERMAFKHDLPLIAPEPIIAGG